MVVRQDAYLTSRATAMQNVESTIHELGGIFQQLAHMVSALLCSLYSALPRLGLGTGRLSNPLQRRAPTYSSSHLLVSLQVSFCFLARDLSHVPALGCCSALLILCCAPAPHNVKRACISAHVELRSNGVVSASSPCEVKFCKVLASLQQCNAQARLQEDFIHCASAILI